MLSPLRCWVYILWEFSLCVYFTVTNSRKKRKIGGQSSKSWIITRMCISTDIDNQIQVPRTCVLLAKIIRLKTIFLRLERKTVKSLHHVWLCNSMDCSTTGFPVHHQLPEFVQTHVHWSGDAIQPFHPLSSPFPPAFNLSQHQGLFQSVLCIRWPKYWSFSFSISPSNEYSGLISFRMDWLDLLAVQETLQSLLQHHGSKASILWHSAFFTVQLSHLYMTTGKTMDLCWQSNVSAF